MSAEILLWGLTAFALAGMGMERFSRASARWVRAWREEKTRISPDTPPPRIEATTLGTVYLLLPVSRGERTSDDPLFPLGVYRSLEAAQDAAQILANDGARESTEAPPVRWARVPSVARVWASEEYTPGQSFAIAVQDVIDDAAWHAERIEHLGDITPAPPPAGYSEDRHAETKGEPR